MLKIIQYLGAITGIALIITCFLPWVTFTQTGETFTGLYTTRFPNGNFYGKPGWFIIPLTVIIVSCLFIPSVLAKRLSLFMVAFLIAYVIRTFNLFTSSLFESDIVKHPGIYLMLVLPLPLLVACLFPNMRSIAESRET